MDSSDGRRIKDQARGLEFYMEKISDFPKFLRNNPVEVTDDMIELYLEVSICKTISEFGMQRFKSIWKPFVYIEVFQIQNFKFLIWILYILMNLNLKSLFLRTCTSEYLT